MKDSIEKYINKITGKFGYVFIRYNEPEFNFHSNHYLRHNARRLEHLASLRVSVAGMTVLEIGAGIGDHSHYYIDRGCQLTITEVRDENLKYLRKRYPGENIQYLNMGKPTLLDGSPFDVLHCYGLLYHLSDPELALEFLSRSCQKLLFLETCVSFDSTKEINLVSEHAVNPTQANSGTGCRPSRAWLFEKLRSLFEYVYLPITQPNHEEFPLDWTAPEKHNVSLSRAIFIASRKKIENDLLTSSFINKQIRHD
ncbi:MAG: methyltransferase domain-containing protein [Thermodesulfovibrionales bacterium]